MRHLLLVVSVIFSLTSCYNVNENKTTIPDVLLTKEQVVEVLTEIQLVEAGFSISETKTIEKKRKPKFYDKILDKYGITLVQLRANVNYYQATPKVMEEIYESVLANLSRIQSEVSLENERIQKEKDSIALALDTLSLEKPTDSILLKK